MEVLKVSSLDRQVLNSWTPECNKKCYNNTKSSSAAQSYLLLGWVHTVHRRDSFGMSASEYMLLRAKCLWEKGNNWLQQHTRQEVESI